MLEMAYLGMLDSSIYVKHDLEPASNIRVVNPNSNVIALLTCSQRFVCSSLGGICQWASQRLSVCFERPRYWGLDSSDSLRSTSPHDFDARVFGAGRTAGQGRRCVSPQTIKGCGMGQVNLGAVRIPF